MEVGTFIFPYLFPNPQEVANSLIHILSIIKIIVYIILIESYDYIYYLLGILKKKKNIKVHLYSYYEYCHMADPYAIGCSWLKAQGEETGP